MSTGVIIAIVVVVVLLILIIGAFLSPQARTKRRERELSRRRDRTVGEYREQAQARHERADEVDQRAQVAQAEAARLEAEAQRHRRDAELHEARANVHEQGLADHELIDERERDRFAGTSAVPEHDAADENQGIEATQPDAAAMSGSAQEPATERPSADTETRQGSRTP